MYDYIYLYIKLYHLIWYYSLYTLHNTKIYNTSLTSLDRNVSVKTVACEGVQEERVLKKTTFTAQGKFRIWADTFDLQKPVLDLSDGVFSGDFEHICAQSPHKDLHF